MPAKALSTTLPAVTGLLLGLAMLVLGAGIWEEVDGASLNAILALIAGAVLSLVALAGAGLKSPRFITWASIAIASVTVIAGLVIPGWLSGVGALHSNRFVARLAILGIAGLTLVVFAVYRSRTLRRPKPRTDAGYAVPGH